MAGSRYNLTRLRGGLRPFRLRWCATTRSTSDLAAAARRRGELYAPAVVVCGRQTAGRGRGRNTWWSSAGCITATFVIPIEENLAPQQVSLVAGLAVREAAARVTGAEGIGLKWPNDVVFAGRKLAGLLCERVEKADLIGIGLNVNLALGEVPPALAEHVTSLSIIAGGALDMTDVLVTLARELHRTLARRKEHPFAELIAEYNRHDALRGRRVTVTGAEDHDVISGRAQGVDSAGRLIVRGHERLYRVVAGTVAVG